MNKNMPGKESFGPFASIAENFAANYSMSLFNDTFDGANNLILRWSSRNGLNCSISLSGLEAPYDGLCLQAFAQQPPLSTLSSFYNIMPSERVFRNTSFVLFDDLLNRSRVWAEEKHLIQRTDNGEYLKPVFQALKARDPRQRYVAAMALVQVQTTDAIEPLIDALEDPDPRVCSFAIVALGKLGDTRAIEPLIGCLNAGNQGHRVAAARSLGCIKDPSAVDWLIFALDDEDDEVRSTAAESLGNIGSISATDPLIKMLQTGTESIQMASAKALGQLANASVIETLQKQMLYSYQPLRGILAEAINHIRARAD